jgi:hypothetical protein
MQCDHLVLVGDDETKGRNDVARLSTLHRLLP